MHCKKPFDIRRRICRFCKDDSECQTERLMKAIFGKDYKKTIGAENGKRNTFS